MAKAKKSGKSPRRNTSLAAFFRKLWSKPKLLAQFSESRDGREQVLQQFKLSARHKKLLIGGCMQDIIRELSGAKASRNVYTNAATDVDCGHPECEAFIKAVKKR